MLPPPTEDRDITLRAYATRWLAIVEHEKVRTRSVDTGNGSRGTSCPLWATWLREEFGPSDARGPVGHNVRPMTWEQRDAFLTAAASEQPYSALFVLLVEAGLRPSEAFALKADDID